MARSTRFCCKEAAPLAKPAFHDSPMYLMKLVDRVGVFLEPQPQHEMMKSVEPIYVHVPEVARAEDGDSVQEMQTSACCFREAAATMPSCTDMRDSEWFQCSHSRIGESRTLLIAYLPRRACAKDVQHVFERFGTVCAANIMRDGHGQSKCFGFVHLETHAAAKSALMACAKGHVILEDEECKAWHIKASWARTKHTRKGSQLAAVSGRSSRCNGQWAYKAATGQRSRRQHEPLRMKWHSSIPGTPLPPGLV